MWSMDNTEIERKFLIKSLPENLSSYEHYEIMQAYICTSPTLRLRRQGDSFIFTFKGKGDIKRTEFEYRLSEEEFNRLWEKVETNKIIKTRYVIPIKNGLKAELDIYHDFLDGFMNVEVEFNSFEQANRFVPPDWFGEDISKKKEYNNRFLAINGIPDNFRK